MRKHIWTAVAVGLIAGVLGAVSPSAAPVMAQTVPPRVEVVKSNNTDGGPIRPGDTFSWRFELLCSHIEVDCVDYVFTDTIPEGFDVNEDTIPASTDDATITWDPETRLLQVEVHVPLDNPVGETGLQAGTNFTFDIEVTLSDDAPYVDGETVTNTAEVEAANTPEGDSDDDLVVIEIPRVVTPVATKEWGSSSAVAGSGDAVSITVGVRNSSSTSTEIGQLTVTDTTPDTFEHFDLTSVALNAWPAGADTAQLRVCTAAGSACPPGGFSPGALVAGDVPLTLPLPDGVAADDVTGVQVIFTNTAGNPLPPDTEGGEIELGLVLRDTFRSTGEDLLPTDNIDIDNCATPSAVDQIGDEPQPAVEGPDACDEFRIFPDVLLLEPSKTFYPDTNGNFTQDANEHAVVGENSPVSAEVEVINRSPFPIEEIVITEPVPTHELDKVEIDVVRVELPAGATNAHVLITYEDGTTDIRDLTSTTTISELHQDGNPITGIEVTFTGTDAEGRPTIAPQSTAGLGIHGNLTDLVDASDIPSGGDPGAGVANCAGIAGDAGRGDGTGTFSGAACDTLPIEERDSHGTGTKSASQASFPPDQPVTFTLQANNAGNLPLVDPVISDPPVDGAGEPVTPNIFDSLEILDATVSTTGSAPVMIEVFVPGDGWVPVATALPGGDLPDATGIRARTTGELHPGQSTTLRVVVQRRPGVPDGVTIDNCFALAADGEDFEPASPWCAPGLSTGPASAGATLVKNIAPGELPMFVPGLPPQKADVTLRVRNSGNLSARHLRMTDADVDFFDAVDLTSIQSIALPAGANRVQLDAFVDGEWVTGSPSTTGAAISAFHSTHDLTQVRGLRVTFTSTSTFNGGYVLTPCTAASCEGRVTYRVTARESLVSNPDQRPDGTIENTVSGDFETLIDEPGTPRPIAPSTADLALVEGTPALDVDKAPDLTTMTPGVPRPFELQVRNTGTNNLPDLVVVDALGPGLTLDTTFEGDGGQPFEIFDVAVPAGTPPPPTPTFLTTADPLDSERIAEARWDFGPDWVLAPGATFKIRIRVLLHPGVTSGQSLTNTLAAGSTTADDMECSDGNDGFDDQGTYGDGVYCTDSSEARVQSGAAFVARKWIAGNPDLGWYHNGSGQIVPLGDPSCPSLDVDGVLYTSTPCIALLNPGDQHQHVLRVRNAGTEPAIRVTIVDRLPAEGDQGVLGNDRGTAWDQRPTLAGAPTVTGPGVATVEYDDDEPLCTLDMVPSSAGCEADAWLTEAELGSVAAALSLQVDIDMALDPLPPGEGVSIAYTMDTPFDVTEDGRPTIAWNSFAHSETTLDGQGRPRDLTPIEPIKVGVALTYGSLEVIKAIDENPEGLDLDDVDFVFAYDCWSTPLGTSDPVLVAQGSLTASPAASAQVDGIPAGATCEVWETGTNGGIPGATEAAPATVVITARMSEADPVSSVTIENDFPFGTVQVAKSVTGDALDEFTTGPFEASVECSFGGGILDGFPRTVTFTGTGTSDPLAVPVGAECRVTETDAGGAGSVAYTPPGSPPTASDWVTVPADGAQAITVGITNTFATGSLVVVKDVIGAGVPELSAGPFTFEVACNFNGQPSVYETSLAVAGSPDGSTVTSEPVTGLPVGATCTVTETDAAGADFTPKPVTVTIDSDGALVEAPFVNPFSAGTISVEKTVDGTAADSDYVRGLTFTLAVSCARDELVEGETRRVTWYEGDLVVAAGERTTAMTASGNPVLLPERTRCWATEPTSGGATAVTVTPDSYETGVEVQPDANAGLQELTIEATNTFDAGELTVTKQAVNGPDGATYQFAVECTIADGGTTVESPLLDGQSPIELAAGESATMQVLAGSTCAVEEVDVPDGAIVSIDDSYGDPSDGAVLVATEAQVEITNAFAPPAIGPSDLGRLPSTGRNIALLVAVGVGLQAAGMFLRRRGRLT